MRTVWGTFLVSDVGEPGPRGSPPTQLAMEECKKSAQQRCVLPPRLIVSDCNMVMQVLTMFEDNYPEGLKRLFVVRGKWSCLPLKGSSLEFRQCLCASHISIFIWCVSLGTKTMSMFLFYNCVIRDRHQGFRKRKKKILPHLCCSKLIETADATKLLLTKHSFNDLISKDKPVIWFNGFGVGLGIMKLNAIPADEAKNLTPHCSRGCSL